MCVCKTANQIMDEIRSHDDGCQNKVKRFNRVLRQFYLNTINIPYNYEAVPLNADGTVITNEPIYRKIAFAARGCSDNQCIFDFKEVCCGEGLKILKMEEIHGGDLAAGQYKQTCDNELEFILPSGAKGAYLIYAKGPIELTNMNEEVCMHSAMLIGFQHALEMFHYQSEGELNRFQLAKTEYKERLEEIKKSTEGRIFKVSGGANNKHLNAYNQ